MVAKLRICAEAAFRMASDSTGYASRMSLCCAASFSVVSAPIRTPPPGKVSTPVIPRTRVMSTTRAGSAMPILAQLSSSVPPATIAVSGNWASSTASAREFAWT